MAQTARTDKWDNVKFFMMLCVVVGHTIYYFYGSSAIAKSIYLFIYLFHMPVFVFVSGLFSKRRIQDKRFDIVIQYLFIYVFMKALDALGCFLCGEKITFHFLWSDGPEWYALAMAVFYLLTMMLHQYNNTYILMMVFFFGCIGGLDSHMGNHFASMRLLTFYPVFLCGYYLDRSRFEFEKKSSLPMQAAIKMAAAAFLLACFVACVRYQEFLWKYINFFKGKTSYMKLKINGTALGMKGVPLRIGCYLLWVVMILTVIALIPNGRFIITKLGRWTQSTFIWHKLLIVVVVQLLGGKAFLKQYAPHYYLWIACCFGGIVTIVTAYLPDLSISRGLGKEQSEHGILHKLLPFVFHDKDCSVTADATESGACEEEQIFSHLASQEHDDIERRENTNESACTREKKAR